MKKKWRVENKEEAQALAEFLFKEIHRHYDDIHKANKDLIALKKQWGVEPRGKYVGKWIEP